MAQTPFLLQRAPKAEFAGKSVIRGERAYLARLLGEIGPSPRRRPTWLCSHSGLSLWRLDQDDGSSRAVQRSSLEPVELSTAKRVTACHGRRRMVTLAENYPDLGESDYFLATSTLGTSPWPPLSNSTTPRPAEPATDSLAK